MDFITIYHIIIIITILVIYAWHTKCFEGCIFTDGLISWRINTVLIDYKC